LQSVARFSAAKSAAREVRVKHDFCRRFERYWCRDSFVNHPTSTLNRSGFVDANATSIERMQMLRKSMSNPSRARQVHRHRRFANRRNESRKWAGLELDSEFRLHRTQRYEMDRIEALPMSKN
jgi:hypothetical protein